jgi:excisionase family DNA binding protein
MPDILTIDQLASYLQMTRRQIYELTSKKGQTVPHPLPVFKINGNIRFRRPDVEAWIAKLAGASEAA